MPEKIYALSELDRQAIQTIISQVLRGEYSTANRPNMDPDEISAPEVYVARTGDDGIPAASIYELEERPSEPGHAVCDIYRVLPARQPGDYELHPVPELKQRVFNISADTITPKSWVLIFRDKLGSWYVSVNPSTEFYALLTMEGDDGGIYRGMYSWIEMEVYGSGFRPKKNGRSGAYNHDPAVGYNREVGLPVSSYPGYGTVVKLESPNRSGFGITYRFNMRPRVDVVKITSTPPPPPGAQYYGGVVALFRNGTIVDDIGVNVVGDIATGP